MNKNLFQKKEHARLALLLSMVLLFSFSLFLIPTVSAVPPQQNFGDLNVEHNSFTGFKQYDSHNFSFFLSNATHLVPNATCYFNLDYANGTNVYSGLTNNFIYPNEYYFFTDVNNFSFQGEYSAAVYCNTTTPQAGGTTFTFDITPTGQNDFPFYLVILIIAGVIIAFGFLIKDGWVTILGTFGLYFVGIYTLRFGIDGIRNLTYSLALSIIILAIAMYISVRSAIEIIGGDGN